MILYDAGSYRDVLFRWKGSALNNVMPQLVLAVVVSLVAAGVYHHHPFTLSDQAFALTIVALGFLLVFRSSLSYGRFWEGRTLMSELTACLIDLSRMNALYLGEDAAFEKAEFTRLLKVVFALTRLHLRFENTDQKLLDDSVASSLLTNTEREQLKGKGRRPLIAIAWLSRVLFAVHRKGLMSSVRLQCFEHQVANLIKAFNGMDKIVTTPLPFPYAQMLLIMLTAYCAAVPFTLVQFFKWYTFLPACMVTGSLFGINSVALEIEDPFGYDANDLPLDEVGQRLLQELEVATEVAQSGP